MKIIFINIESIYKFMDKYNQYKKAKRKMAPNKYHM